MSPSLVLAIEPSGVGAVEPVHATREVRLRRLDDEMEVVSHQHIGGDAPAEALDNLGEEAEEGFPIGIGEEDGALLIAAGSDVVDGAGKLDAKCSCHSPPRFPRMIRDTEKSPRCSPYPSSTSSEWKIALQGAERRSERRKTKA